MDEIMATSSDDNEDYKSTSNRNGNSSIVYTIPLQLLSYHVVVLKGTDVDQPRNLGKICYG